MSHRVAIIAFVLGVACATAWAEPAMDATTRAWNVSVAAQRHAGELGAQRNTLGQRYEDELRSNAQLKNQRPSWRRDRELQDALAEANETAKKLAAVTSELARAQTELAAAHRTLIAAIDTELATNPDAARRAQLDRARTQVMPSVRRAARRIVLPDLQIDPLADPEELDQQAAALRDSELELQKQIGGLDAQAKELDHVAMLRKQHERTNELDHREDPNPHRTTTQSSGGGRLTDATGGPAPAEGHDSGSPTGPAASFEADAAIILADIVDPSTLDSLSRAARTQDPAKRADAARRTRDAVAAKVELLRAKRAQIEARARQERAKPGKR